MNVNAIIRVITGLRRASFQLTLVMVALLFSNTITVFYQDGHGCAVELAERGETDTSEENNQTEKGEKDKQLNTLFKSGMKYGDVVTLYSGVSAQWGRPWIEIYTPPPQMA